MLRRAIIGLCCLIEATGSGSERKAESRMMLRFIALVVGLVVAHIVDMAYAKKQEFGSKDEMFTLGLLGV